MWLTNLYGSPGEVSRNAYRDRQARHPRHFTNIAFCCILIPVKAFVHGHPLKNIRDPIEELVFNRRRFSCAVPATPLEIENQHLGPKSRGGARPIRLLSIMSKDLLAVGYSIVK
jgi:hypothetical protein